MLQIQNAWLEPFGPEQSFYLTCADVQTIPQASVYYLIELTSLGSLNSLYFIPSSVVANNGRYTKMNFYVWPGYQFSDPALGQITFNKPDPSGDNPVFGWTKYPMGFYTYKVYEQTSSTNLDPTLATSQLEEGMAIVRSKLGLNREVEPNYVEYPVSESKFELIKNGRNWVGATGNIPPNNWTNGSVPTTALGSQIIGGIYKQTNLEVGGVTELEIQQNVKLVTGVNYRLTFTGLNGVSGSNLKLGSTLGGSEINIFSALTQTNVTFDFVAPEQDCYVSIETSPTITDAFTELNTISIKAINDYFTQP